MQVREDLAPPRRRAALLLLGVLLALGAIHLRLAHLQLLTGDHWRQLADNNRLRRLPLPAVRGRIFDRSGQLLADTRPSFELLLFPDEAADLDRTVLFLARSGIAGAATLRQRLEDHRSSMLAPVLIGEELSWEQVARIRSHQSDHPELSVVERFRRHYPLGAGIAHVVGHLRLVTATDLEAEPGLDRNALVGAIGVEALYEEQLAGRDGERWVVVSAVGRQLGLVREVPAQPGPDLSTTLDMTLQHTAALALGDEAGAVVGLEPSSGAVRVMYSSPSFDPNVFVGRLSQETWQEIRSDPRHPLQNRCIQSAYPPGSTVKPFLALGGLAEGLVSPSWEVACSGAVTLHNHRFRCWARSGHGGVGLRRSLEVSCDSYYYLLGQRLGIQGIARWMHRFGFGSRTGLGLEVENAGLVGTPEWAERVRGTPWYPGEAVSVSIGQGPVLATALQLARAYAALANGGRLVTPYLVESPTMSPPVDLELDPQLLASVVNGLERVVHGPEGTARRLSSLPVAGKTGTSQVARLQDGVKNEDLPKELRHHALFVGWGPLDGPNLVLVVLVEHGGGGGSVAAPVAGRVFRAAFDPPQPDATSRRAPE